MDLAVFTVIQVVAHCDKNKDATRNGGEWKWKIKITYAKEGLLLPLIVSRLSQEVVTEILMEFLWGWDVWRATNGLDFGGEQFTLLLWRFFYGEFLSLWDTGSCKNFVVSAALTEVCSLPVLLLLARKWNGNEVTATHLVCKSTTRQNWPWRRLILQLQKIYALQLSLNSRLINTW